MLSKKIAQNCYQINIEGKTYSLKLYTKSSRLFFVLSEISSILSSPVIFKVSYTQDELNEMNDFFKMYDNLEKIIIAICLPLSQNQFELFIEQSRALLFFEFVFAKITFILNLETQKETNQKAASLAPPIGTQDLVQLNKFIEKITKEKEQLVKANKELIASNEKLKKENTEMKNRLKELEKQSCKNEESYSKLKEKKLSLTTSLDEIKKELKIIRAAVNKTDKEKEAEKEIEKKLGGDLLTESTIAETSESKLNISNWISKNKKIETNLLYRASKDGDKVASFHSKCDNKGSTLILIKTNDNYCFGGYTEKTWESIENYKTDEKAFVFSLDKKAMYKPINPEHSIFCSDFYGPVFGAGNDFCIKDNFLSNNESYSNTPFTYDIPVEGGLTGYKKNFKVSELEVYKITIV